MFQVPGVTYRPLAPSELGVELAAATVSDVPSHVARALEVLTVAASRGVGDRG